MRSRAIVGIVLGAAIGSAFGIGGYTFIYAKGSSYLLNDPAACANCHIMNDQYNGWLKSSHRSAATCNDCHTPSGFVAKYASKASNGFWHSFAFTSGRFHEPINIKPHNRRITENACRKCHAEITDTARKERTSPASDATAPSAIRNEPISSSTQKYYREA